MIQSVFEIIKGTLGLVIPKERGVLFKEMHITVRFLCKIAQETMEKVCLPLQNLEFEKIGWGW